MAIKNVEIRVYGKERTGQDGNTFVVYSYTPNGQRWLKVAFTKDCATTPKKKGYFKLVVNPTKMSIKKGRTITEEGRTYTENDTLFISEVISLHEDKEYEKVVQARRQSEVEDMLALDEEIDFEATFNA